MNAANLKKSKRLKRVMRVLRRGGMYTTRELIRQAHVCAVNSIISELRANGYRIGCKRISRTTWGYMLEGRA